MRSSIDGVLRSVLLARNASVKGAGIKLDRTFRKARPLPQAFSLCLRLLLQGAVIQSHDFPWVVWDECVEERLTLGTSVAHPCRNRGSRVISAVAIKVAAMPILATRGGWHGDPHVHVVAPTHHLNVQVVWQVNVDNVPLK